MSIGKRITRIQDRIIRVQSFARCVLPGIVVFVVSACQGVPVDANPDGAYDQNKVVLLHGLKRSSWSMKKIEWHLEKTGFVVCNIDYPSDRQPVSALVDHIVTRINQCFGQSPEPLNFVSHSLGGLMIRALEVSDNGPEIARAVMIAPPNHGSELVDLHRNSRLFRALMGPVAVLLGTEPGSLPRRLGPATFDVGIIAGNGKSNPLGLWVFDEPNDGTVSVASTRLEGMNDFIVVPFGHTFIMRKDAVIEEIRHYLINGRFSPAFKP